MKNNIKDYGYNKLTETQKAYWAGLLDGEGHLGFDKNTPTVTLAMTCEKTLKAFKDQLLGCSLMKRSRNNMKEYWKDCYVSKVSTHKAAQLCKELLPYFITKQEIAKEIANFYNKECEVCQKEFIGFGKSTVCSVECYNVRKAEYARNYRKGAK